MREGEQILEIEETDEAWWTGTTANGQRGLFPCTSLTLLVPSSMITYTVPLQRITLSCKNKKSKRINVVHAEQETTNAVTKLQMPSRCFDESALQSLLGSFDYALRTQPLVMVYHSVPVAQGVSRRWRMEVSDE